jgi:hypothetical protein
VRPRVYFPGMQIGRLRLVKELASTDHNQQWIVECLDCGNRRRCLAPYFVMIKKGICHGRCRSCYDRNRPERQKRPRGCECGETDPAKFVRGKATECQACQRRRQRNGRCPACRRPRISTRGVKTCPACEPGARRTARAIGVGVDEKTLAHAESLGFPPTLEGALAYVDSKRKKGHARVLKMLVRQERRERRLRRLRKPRPEPKARAPRQPLPACLIKGCASTSRTRGLCDMHYGRWRLMRDSNA